VTGVQTCALPIYFVFSAIYDRLYYLATINGIYNLAHRSYKLRQSDIAYQVM
jgi:hypothetical protein